MTGTQEKGEKRERGYKCYLPEAHQKNSVGNQVWKNWWTRREQQTTEEGEDITNGSWN